MNWTALAYVAVGFATQIPWAIYAIRGDREVARLTRELVLIGEAVHGRHATIAGERAP